MLTVHEVTDLMRVSTITVNRTVLAGHVRAARVGSFRLRAEVASSTERGMEA